MLSPEQERCPPARARFWLSTEGARTFRSMVQRLAPGEAVDGERALAQLRSALRASDFAPPEEVEGRVHSAARELAERMRAEALRIARHRQFVTQPQVFRPDVVYGESDGPVRDSLSNSVSTTPQHNFFAEYLAQQGALGRGGRAAE